MVEDLGIRKKNFKLTVSNLEKSSNMLLLIGIPSVDFLNFNTDGNSRSKVKK